MQNEYQRKDVEEITGVKASTVQQYTDKGLIMASVADPGVRGATRLYSSHDMVELLICRELVTAGIKHDHIREIMELLRDRGIKFLLEDSKHRSIDPKYLIIYDPGLETLRVTLSSRNELGKEPYSVDLDMEGKHRASVVDVTRIIKIVESSI